MNDAERKIYDDISMEILNYLSQNGIKYDLKKEKKAVMDSTSQILQDSKNDFEVKEIFSMRFIALFNYIEKIIPPLPRNVYFSKYLLKRIDEDLNEDIINKIKIFKQKFESGEDINSNLSKGIFNSNSWDYILNIWNIRHLHLSESVELNKDAMSNNRSDYLLFFVLDGENVYFIDVRKHPKGAGFTSFQFLEILDESDLLNLIGFQEIKDIIDLNLVIEKDEDIYQLTKCGMNIIYKINEKHYINVSGITSVGNKMDHTFIMMNIRKKISNLLGKNQIEYIGFELLLNGCLGVIKYKIDSKEKQLIL